MELVLENSDVKVKQAQKCDREQVFVIVLKIYFRHEERAREHAS